MGLSIRIFVIEEDDTIKHLPLARYERLLKRDPNESLPKYAGQRVIDARHKFAKKRYFDKYRWEPSDKIIAAIGEAIFGKNF
jgi:hypothetical protein